MWETIATIFRSFQEKYLIPLVISIVVAIATVIILPDDFWMINKVGRFPFACGVAGITFLFVVFVLYVVDKVKLIQRDVSNKRCSEEQKRKDAEEKIRLIWQDMDHYSPEERKEIRELVESGNQPIKISLNREISYKSIYKTNLFVNTIILDDQGEQWRAYKLNEVCYQDLKYSLETYNKISNFD